MTSDEFAQKIKEKYPQYQNVDNQTLTQKMIAKYPQYKNKVDMNATSTAEPGSLLSATQNSDPNMAQAATKLLLDKGQELMTKLTGTGQEAMSRASQAVASYGDKKIGLPQAALNFAGAGAGALTSGAMDVASTLTPQSIKQPVKDAISSIASLPGVSGGIQAVNDWAKKNPDAASSLQSLFDIGTLGVGSESKPIAEEGVKVLGQGAKAVGEQLDEKVIPKAADILAKKSEEKTAKGALDAIVDPSVMTKGEKLAAAAKGDSTPMGILKKGGLDATAEQTRLANKFKDLLGSGTNIEKLNAIHDYIANKGEAMTSYLKSNNAIFNNATLKSNIKSALDDVIPEGEMEAQKKTVINTLMSKINKNTMFDLWRARSKFDDVFDTIFNTGEQNLSEQLKSVTRKAVNNFIEDKIPDSKYKALLKDMTDAYKVGDEKSILARKAIKEYGQSKLGNIILNPTVRKLLNKAVEGTGIGIGASALGL